MSYFRFLRSPLFYLLIIIVLAFLVRIYKIDNPVADWHAWRQADTASVARYFYQVGYNPLIPKYDDMSGVAENPVPNFNRYRFVEFPIYTSVVYFTYYMNGGVNEALARGVNIIFSLGSLIFVYLVAKKYFGIATALVSSLIFAFLPFNIFFSRVILPEPSLVFFCLGMFYYTDKWIRESGVKLFILSVVFTSLAMLTKPMAIFYLLPLLYLYRAKVGRWFPVPARFLAFLVFAFVPFTLWRVWMMQFPEGIPASNWLLNGNGIRLRPAFFRWIIGDRFGREILGVAGTFLFFLGILIRPKNPEGVVMHLLALSMFLYLIVFATGNVQHDYYQTMIVPVLSIFLARGVISLITGINGFIPRIYTIVLGVLFFILTFYLTWGEVKGLYQINNPVIVEAGREADRILPKDAVVVAPYGGDTSFLYYVNRPGLPFIVLPIEEIKKDYGVNFLVSTAKDAKTKWTMRKYKIVKETDKYVIVDLREVNPKFDEKSDPEP